MKKIKSLLCALSSITIAATSIGVAIPTVMAAETAETTIAADEASTGYHYVYAGLTWAEYWASEGVYNADDVTSSDVADSRGETDKGGFDAVSRATTNHGLHRGSYQCMTTIETEDGSKYGVSYWTSEKDDSGKVTKTILHTTNGEEVTFAKGVLTFADGSTKTMIDYDVTGLKYIPVAVADADYEDFRKNYTVVENGGQLVGGYSEGNLKSYNFKSDVTADTNGLKEAVKNSDGTFSFKSRSTGKDSGIADTALKTVPDTVVATVKPGEGNYGEFLRVDLTGEGYGDLGAAMQAVKWTYYGSDSTRTKALQTYGTKFAADNWMHKSMGVQLGLTKSLRCQLPEGTDGTGYWKVTVYALGYQDYTFEVQATSENIVSDNKGDEKVDTTELQKVVDEAKKLVKADYTASSWASFETELAEAEDELKTPHTQATVNEAIAHLQNAIKELVKVQKETETKTPETKTDINNDKNNQTQTAYKAKVKLNSVKNTKGRKAVLKWKKVKNADGYVVYRATKKKGQYAAVKTINKGKTVTFTNKNLKKGKTYYYKIKAYKKVNGKKALGQFSAVKSVKIKK